MKYEDVKKTAEQMACKIFEYIHATDLSSDKKDELFYELSASFLTSGIHEADIEKANMKIQDTCMHIYKMAVLGYSLSILGYDRDRIIKDLSD